MADHLRVVDKLLRELELYDLPRLTVFNKIDLVEDKEWLVELAADHDGVLVSAMDPTTFPPLLKRARQAVLKAWQ